MPTPTSTPSSTATATVSPSTIQSDIFDFTFQDLTVKVGDTVVWTNRGITTHTSTSGTNGIFDGQGWDSGFMSTNETFGHSFTTAGTFPYTCVVHPFMNATMTVTE